MTFRRLLWKDDNGGDYGGYDCNCCVNDSNGGNNDNGGNADGNNGNGSNDGNNGNNGVVRLGEEADGGRKPEVGQDPGHPVDERGCDENYNWQLSTS